MNMSRGTAKRSGAPPVSRGTSEMSALANRLTGYFFRAVAFGCFVAVGYLLTRWWMGQ